MTMWKVHDHGKVTYVWDTEDKCEALSHKYSYERLGLYYRTRTGLQPFCHLHFTWEMHVDFRIRAEACYTAPGESRLTIDTTRNAMDLLAFSGQDEGIAYDAMGKPVMDPQEGYSDRLDLLNGGYVVYFGDPRPDMELVRQAKTFQGGMRRLGGRIGHTRNLECWLLGPVSLVAGQQLYGSIVAKLRGRFENGMGFQPCTLWQSHYAQDGKAYEGYYTEGTLKGAWEGADSEEVKMIRSNLSPLPLPSYASRVVWKVEQYRFGRTMCETKAMSG
ncbi:MAG TPA: hypothetical protein VG826_34260 [Pirellulales bacterium]|nr:hypothetical protein [Pirellulales bacterium]